MIEVACEGSLQAFGVHKSVEGDTAVDQFVSAVDVGMQPSLAQCGFSLHPVQVILTITESLDVGPCPQLGGRREEVGPLSVGFHMGCQRAQSHVGNKMLQWESLCVHGGGVFHLVGVESHKCLHLSPTLRGREVGSILMSVDLEISVDVDSLGYLYLLCDRGVEGCRHEAEVGGVAFQMHVRLEVGWVIEVGYISVAAHLQRRGQ